MRYNRDEATRFKQCSKGACTCEADCQPVTCMHETGCTNDAEGADKNGYPSCAKCLRKEQVMERFVKQRIA